MQDYFLGRKLLIATRHKKEKVIQPLLEKELGVRCVVPDSLDTDRFGTFTGEKERSSDPLSTAIHKCRWAMELYQCDLAVASEGSFGPHPTAFFMPADDEWVVLIDTKNQMEIQARVISTATNFRGQYIEMEEALMKFAEKALFPSHGLILRPDEASTQNMYKGITDQAPLKKYFNALLKQFGKAFVETDMRALYNPTRMSVIQQATERLLKKISSTCPECRAPGFDVEQVNDGLPCEWCGSPTNSILSLTYRCRRCGYEKDLHHPQGKDKADPGTCNYCNP